MKRDRHAYTLVELLTVTAIVILLASLLLGVIGIAREKGRQVGCAGHLRQTSHSIAMFAPDNSRNVPNSITPWDRSNSSFALLSNYTARSTAIFRCPSDKRRPTRAITNFTSFVTITNYCSYSLNRRMIWGGSGAIGGSPLGINVGLQDAVVAMDRVGTSTNGFELLSPPQGIPGATWTNSNHRKVGNVLYADGRVQTVASLAQTNYAGYAFTGGGLSYATGELNIIGSSGTTNAAFNNMPRIGVQNPL